VTQKPDGRSALSIGMDWGTRVTTIGLEFALPAFLGFFLDRWWSTAPWMTILGAFLGLGIGMVQLVRLATELSGSSKKRRATRRGSSGDGKPTV
jgi:ATP synthase protein I